MPPRRQNVVSPVEHRRQPTSEVQAVRPVYGREDVASRGHGCVDVTIPCEASRGHLLHVKRGPGILGNAPSLAHDENGTRSTCRQRDPPARRATPHRQLIRFHVNHFVCARLSRVPQVAPLHVGEQSGFDTDTRHGNVAWLFHVEPRCTSRRWDRELLRRDGVRGSVNANNTAQYPGFTWSLPWNTSRCRRRVPYSSSFGSAAPQSGHNGHLCTTMAS